MTGIDGRLIVPLTNPELPPVASDFVEWSQRIREPVEHVLRRCLYTVGGYDMKFTRDKSGAKVLATLLSGHRWYEDARGMRRSAGPERCDAMVISKHPVIDDVHRQRFFTGELGMLFKDALRQAKFSDDEIHSLYLCGLLSTVPLIHGKSSAMWYKTQRMLWMQQLLLVRPRVVLLQGAEVVKEVLGKQHSLASCEGRVIERQYNLAQSADDEPIWHTVQFVTSVSPVAVLHDRRRPGGDSKYRTQTEQRMHKNLILFRKTLRGEEDRQSLDNVEQLVIRDSIALEAELKRMRQEVDRGLVAWDAEWQGDHPQNPGTYLRCIQFAYRTDRSATIALTHPGGEPCFKAPGPDGQLTTKGAAKEVARLCKQYMKGLRVVGHFFNADLEMLIPFGLDLRDEFDAAPSYEEVQTKGGVATELMAHAWDETQKFGLDDQIATHLEIPLYSQQLEAYKKEAEKLHKQHCTASLAPYREAVREYKKASRAVAKMSELLVKSKKVNARTQARWREQQLKLRLAEQRLLAAEEEKKRIVADNEARTAELRGGYGWIPDEVLYPYAGFDVVAELMLAHFYLDAIKQDRFSNNCYQAYWHSHRAALPVLEINCTGLMVNRGRLDQLSVRFARVTDAILARIRDKINWPTFNPESRFEFAELLFGEEYNGMLPQYGKLVRKRPPGAFTIRAEPLQSTGDYPTAWTDIIEKGKQLQVAPSCGKQTLGELYHTGVIRVRRFNPRTGKWVYRWEDHKELLGLLRSYRIMSQALKQVLHAPETDAAERFVEDDEGNFEYDKGIANYIDADGRVRTRIRQTLETGRWASIKPNLQNISKSREADYAKIIQEVEAWPELSRGLLATGGYRGTSVRAIFSGLEPSDLSAGGEPWFLVESDYTGAELLVVAINSQDLTMIDHCLRNQLPEDHPDFFDIHSNLTVKAFRFDCEPTKAGLESIGKKHLRQAGKAIVFGSLYGRSARAIATALRQDGTVISEAEASDLLQTFFEMYPDMKRFLDSCKDRVNVGWLKTMFGRYRRFPFTADDTKFAAMGREAMNAPIQGAVADAINIAVRNLYDIRNGKCGDFWDRAEQDFECAKAFRRSLRFRISLAIHDAILLLVPASELDIVCRPGGVLKTAMIDQVPLIPTDLDGNRLLGAETYHFGSSIEIYRYWGELLYPDTYLEMNHNPELGGWVKQEDGSWFFPESGKTWNMAV